MVKFDSIIRPDEMNIKKWILTILCFAANCTFLFSKDYSVLSYGAISDGKTLCTESIQSAIDAAYVEGGGRVIIPKGSFLTGSIILKSNVELHLENNALLLGSTQPNDYIKLNFWKALILADSAENLSISGKGTIEGQGAQLALNIDSLFYVGQIDSAMYSLSERRPKEPMRPQLIELRNCKRINISGITLKNAAAWVQTYHLCQDLVIDHIKVESDAYWNNDGIDIVDCKNVKITNCNINSSDDGICIKSVPYKGYEKAFCDSIYIANCIIRSSASAIKFGSWSYTGFRNVKIENIKVYDTFRSAIAIEVVQGGFLENVEINDISAKNTGNAIFIRLGKMTKKIGPGSLKNVSIKNVKVKIPFKRPDYQYNIRGPELPFFHNTFPASITGIPSQSIDNLRLENIKISYPGRGNKAYAYAPLSRLDDIPEKENAYPEFSMFGELPAWGFYVRHVNGISFSDIEIKIRKGDYRPAFVFDDVQGLKLNDIQIKGDKKANKIIYHNSESRRK